MKKSLSEYILAHDWSPPSSEDSFRECYLHDDNAIVVDDYDQYNKNEHVYALDSNWTIFILIIEAYYIIMIIDV